MQGTTSNGNDPNATNPILKFNETVISIADETIPKTSTNPKHPGKPWFNDECKDAINNSEKTERRFGKHPRSDNLVILFLN